MTKVIFIDNRSSIVDKVAKIGIQAIHGDYFDLSVKIPRHVLCTTSNPSFTFGGGIDRFFYEKFPHYCETKQLKGGGNERIGNICFTISVSSIIKANDELVRNAIRFAIDNTDETETLILSGIGTGVRLLNEDKFVEILAEEIKMMEPFKIESCKKLDSRFFTVREKHKKDCPANP